jgi:hypothetical protein
MLDSENPGRDITSNIRSLVLSISIAATSTVQKSTDLMCVSSMSSCKVL